VKMRLHALMAFIGGLIGIGATVWYFFTPVTTGRVGAFVVLSIVALIIYGLAIGVGLLDQRARQESRLAKIVKAALPIAALSSLVCCLLLGWAAGKAAGHAVPCLILLSALVNMPRSVYDPLL